jgi:hypothetical protein
MGETINQRIIELCDAALHELDYDKRMKLIRELGELIEKHAAEKSARLKNAGV